MSRITKTIAENTAELLLKDKFEEIEKSYDELKELLLIHHNEQIPDKVKECCNEYKEFFNIYYNLYSGWELGNMIIGLNENDKNHENNYIIRKHESGNIIFKSQDEKSKFIKIFQKLNKKKIELENLKTEITQTLINLRTYKKVEDEFNEAFQLLPIVTTTAIAINMSSIRTKLNNI